MIVEHCIRDNWREILLPWLQKVDGFSELPADEQDAIIEHGLVAVNARKGQGISTYDALDACRWPLSIVLDVPAKWAYPD